MNITSIYNYGWNGDKLMSEKEKKSDFEMQIKLHINQNLYDAGHITEEMYTKAKEIIYRSCK